VPAPSGGADPLWRVLDKDGRVQQILRNRMPA